MRLDDPSLDRLRRTLDEPDLSGTPYRLVGPIGRGGMGAVWDVVDQRLGRNVALKVLATPDDDGSLARRMLDEARILAVLEHPGIVPVHDAGTLPDGRAYYVMKRVRGRVLTEAAADLTLHDALSIFARVCDAVAFAHAHGVLHRDLNPSNIMLGEFGVALVLDWGVAKRIAADAAGRPAASLAAAAGRTVAGPPAPQATTITASAATRTGHVADDPATQVGTRIGTHGYMSPEQQRGEIASVGPCTDVYSLGRVLAFLVANATTSPPALQRRPLEAIVSKATAESPGRRYTDAAELGRDIARLTAGAPVTAYPEGPMRRARRVLAPHTTAIVLIATYILLRVTLILARGF